jgi:hypothetical protein
MVVALVIGAPLHGLQGIILGLVRNANRRRSPSNSSAGLTFLT